MSKYIYVLESDNNKRVKIGITDNPRRRIKQLQESGGFGLENCYITDALEYAEKLESLIHAILEIYRVVGEWFEYPFEDAVRLVKVITTSITLAIEEDDLQMTQKLSEYKSTTESFRLVINDLRHIVTKREAMLAIGERIADENENLTWAEVIEIRTKVQVNSKHHE